MTPRPVLSDTGPRWALTSPVVQFPRNVIDADGRPLRPGVAVEIVDGSSAGLLGEVVGWGGARGVEVLLTEDIPRVVAVPASALRSSDEELAERVRAFATVVSPAGARVGLVQPVGTQDVVPRSEAAGGILPPPERFITKRGYQTKAAARKWGEACLEVLEPLAPGERAAVCARELDAPIVRRALLEASLPPVVERVVFVVSDQNPPHADDTRAFGELLSYWLHGLRDRFERAVGGLGEPIVLKRLPHMFPSVLEEVGAEVSRVAEGLDEVVVVQAGGTPAMCFGTLMAFTTGAPGVVVRHLQVPLNGPVTEVDMPSMIRRDQVLSGARVSLSRRDPMGALVALGMLGSAPMLAEAVASARIASQLLRHEEVDAGDLRAAKLPRKLARQLPRPGGVSQHYALASTSLSEAITSAVEGRVDRYGESLCRAVRSLAATWLAEALAGEGGYRRGGESSLLPGIARALEDHLFVECPAGTSTLVRQHISQSVRSEGLLEPGSWAAEVFRCVGSPLCTCGLKRLRSPAGLLGAARAYRAVCDHQGVLFAELARSDPMLVSTGMVTESLSLDEPLTAGKMRQALRDVLRPFLEELGSDPLAFDLLEELCSHAEHRLGEVSN